MVTYCVGTKYESEELAKKDCTEYLVPEYCLQCQFWHIVLIAAFRLFKEDVLTAIGSDMIGESK